MTPWYDGTTAGTNAAARKYVTTKDNQVTALGTALTNATNTYNNAQASVSNYEKNSPVGASIAAAAVAATKSQTVKNILYIVGTLAGIGIIIQFVRWFEKRKTATA